MSIDRLVAGVITIGMALYTADTAGEQLGQGYILWGFIGVALSLVCSVLGIAILLPSPPVDEVKRITDVFE